MKRAIDFMGALSAMAIVAPVVPLIVLAIKLDSPGPVLFRQRRAGGLFGGVPGRLEFTEFDIVKFRTMRVDAERDTGPVLARAGDTRVTAIGRFLRKSRLDELPQLWNVLRGDMSLVGPRPERPELLAHLAMAIPFFEERMRGVQPGITGLAQVNLSYSGRAPADSPVAKHHKELGNPYGIESAEGADADGMRLKLLFDLAYAASLESPSTYMRTELSVILKTPLVMIRGLGT